MSDGICGRAAGVVASIDSEHGWIARRRVLKLLDGLDRRSDGRKDSLM